MLKAPLTAIAVAASVSMPVSAQSFNCRWAKSADEVAICQDANVEQAREQLWTQAAADRSQAIISKMNELGFQVISPVDLELEWSDFIRNKKKVALWGNYTQVDGIDGLIVASRDQPVIRLYYGWLASRDARKTMAECRETGATACPMVIGGTVLPCVANKNKINERKLPCLDALEAYTVPEGWPPAMAERK